MTDIFKKKVGPSDCTMAIALPLTKEEFLADLQSDAPKDYAKYYRSLMWGKRGEEELWAQYRDNMSRLIEGVAIEVERLGVKVVRSVRLMDIPSLFSDRDIITLVSHWRASDVEAQDFIDFARFVDKLKNSSDDVIVHLRQRLSSSVAKQVHQYEMTDENFSSFQKLLVDELNSLLESENLGRRRGFDNSATEQPLHAEQRTYLNRITMDAAFDGELKKGNRMEFFDGLQSAEAIRDKIPDRFAGFLDLIVCNSILPAEAIRSMKRNCLIISNQFPAQPSFRLLLYKAMIQALHHKPDSYVKVMTEVRQGLGNHLKNYA